MQMQVGPYRAELCLLLHSGRETISLLKDDRQVSGASVQWLATLWRARKQPAVIRAMEGDRKLASLVAAYAAMSEVRQ
jgi:hypothetical protein